MKKFYLLMLLALPLLAFSACDDDDKLPDVSLSAQIDGATRVNDVLYVVQGDTLDIVSINMEDNTKKGAVIGGVEYFWDYYRIGGNIVSPYGMSIVTEGVPAGNHFLQILASVYAVDYAPCEAFMGFKVKLVPSASDIPTDGTVEPSPTLHLGVRSTDDD